MKITLTNHMHTIACLLIITLSPVAFGQKGGGERRKPPENLGGLTNNDIDAIANELTKSPRFKDGGHEGKIGFWLTRGFNMDWPVKNKDVRATWNIDPKQDTDKDGTPDVDDNDIDGDGIVNVKDRDIDGDGKKNKDDKNPYDSTVQFKPNGGSPATDDSDGDGMPDIFDNFPNNPRKSFRTPRLEKDKDRIVAALWSSQ